MNTYTRYCRISTVTLWLSIGAKSIPNKSYREKWNALFMSRTLHPVSLTGFAAIKQKNCYAARRFHEFITEFLVVCPHSLLHYGAASSVHKQLSISTSSAGILRCFLKLHSVPAFPAPRVAGCSLPDTYLYISNAVLSGRPQRRDWRLVVVKLWDCKPHHVPLLLWQPVWRL